MINNGENMVFISYAWGGESERTVDKLEQAFAGCDIQIVRDKKDLGYKGSIETFEQRIGQGQCIILVISDKYLRSEHCMYELVLAGENKEFRERIFPIVLPDAKIYKAVDRLSYIKYWDEKIKELNLAIKNIEVMTNLANINADLDKYACIRTNFDQLIELLSDMNALTPEIHSANDFSILINAVKYSLDKKLNVFQHNKYNIDILNLFIKTNATQLSLDAIAKNLKLTEKKAQLYLDDLSRHDLVKIKPRRAHGSLISYYYEITPKGIEAFEKG